MLGESYLHHVHDHDHVRWLLILPRNVAQPCELPERTMFLVQEQIFPILRVNYLLEGSCPYHVPYHCKEHSTKKYNWYLLLPMQQMN